MATKDRKWIRQINDRYVEIWRERRGKGSRDLPVIDNVSLDDFVPHALLGLVMELFDCIEDGKEKIGNFRKAVEEEVQKQTKQKEGMSFGERFGERELFLKEWCDRLPVDHIANKELRVLYWMLDGYKQRGNKAWEEYAALKKVIVDYANGHEDEETKESLLFLCDQPVDEEWLSEPDEVYGAGREKG